MTPANSPGLIRTATAALLTACLCIGCAQEPTPPLYEPGDTGRPSPSIASLAPDSAIAGVTTILIQGANFSAIPDENFVYFGSTRGRVVSATTSVLQAISPIMEGDSVKVKVAVLGAERFSNTMACVLRLPSRPLGGISVADAPWAVAMDDSGNIYVSLLTSGVGVGVKKFAVDGSISSYAPRRFETKYSTMKFGPDGFLYAAWNVRAIAQIPGNMGNPILWLQLPTGVKISTFDFDAGGNIWAGGQNTSIYFIRPDKSYKTSPLNANIRSIMRSGTDLYVAGAYSDSLEQVYRYPIIAGADSLGVGQLVFDLAQFPGTTSDNAIYTVNLNSDGDLLMGTDLPDPILHKSAGPGGLVSVFYPDIFNPTIHSLVWGKGQSLLAIRGEGLGGAVASSTEILIINAQMSGIP